jgi:hypothetical protein
VSWRTDPKEIGKGDFEVSEALFCAPYYSEVKGWLPLWVLWPAFLIEFDLVNLEDFVVLGVALDDVFLLIGVASNDLSILADENHRHTVLSAPEAQALAVGD